MRDPVPSIRIINSPSFALLSQHPYLYRGRRFLTNLVRDQMSQKLQTLNVFPLEDR
jgi:hypothetical protein